MTIKKFSLAFIVGLGLLISGGSAFARDHDRDDRGHGRWDRHDYRYDRDDRWRHERREWRRDWDRDRDRRYRAYPYSGYSGGYYYSQPYYYSDPYYNYAPYGSGFSGYFSFGR